MRFDLLALPVMAAIGSVNAAAVSTKHSSSVAPTSAKSSPAKSPLAHNSPVKSSPAKSSPAKSSSAKSSTAKSSSAKATSAKSSSAKAASVRSSSAKSSPAVTGPSTISNTASAISSVMSAMSAQSPKHTSTTAGGAAAPVTVTASAAKGSAKPTTTTATSTAKKMVARADVSACAALPNYGYSYVPAPAASPAAFLGDNVLRNTALAASAPSGYNWLYAGYYASLQQDGYMQAIQLSSYNQTACGQICNNNYNCHAFTIYYERDPTLAPGVGCTNPSSQTSVKCVIYDRAINTTYTTNVGEWRSDFAVVIAGANGYNKIN